MTLTLNKKEIDATGLNTLGQLLTLHNLTSPGIAVAIDGKVVPRAAWNNTALADGMRITVISAVCGG